MAHPKGGYRNKDGKKVPGVTTIIGRFKDSGGLMHWAFKQGQRAERGEIDKLYDERDKAGDSGTLAHSMVEAHIRGEDPPDIKDIAHEISYPAGQAFKAYLTWANQSKLEIVEQEMPLVSEKYQFGGCPDAIGLIDNELCLVDWKTSSGIYPDYLIQLAAYKHLYESNNPEKKLTGGFHLCRFAKANGDFSHHYYPNLDEAWEQFKLFRAAYDIDKQLKKRV